MTPIPSLIALFIRDVAELPDRTSPEGWPEAMLVTAEELDEMLRTFAADVLTRAVHHPAVADAAEARAAIIDMRNAAQGATPVA